ncbi:MAG TPA: alpha/beta family hydrolase [Steroidobacter sp.]|jgi:predicted alpha/beta-hydrolase family hydrolase|nr:dienelactone hydrolase family protein [Steroidobacteraceae bacterium]HLS82779.1 alpha/beta family hydrolase [Steroidobacter sp.]
MCASGPLIEELSTIAVDDTHEVSGLWLTPSDPLACFVLAHGAGAGMRHPAMATLAHDLAERGIATFRYQFPYMERGSRRPDPPALCHATVRAAVAAAARLTGKPLIAGGRSFGGRMTSQAQAAAALAGVRGLAFLAFPLHPAKRLSDERAAHLFNVQIPMLFLQGARDDLADLALLEPLVARLGKRARLHVLQEADHSFHAPARSGRKDAEIRAEAVSVLVEWIRMLLGSS